jgi:hypothetical protein
VDPWALSLGAMVPDLPVFLPLLSDGEIWHSVVGVFTVDLLAVVALLAIFHGLLRDPLIALLPPDLVGRAASLRPSYRLRSIASVLLAGVIGAFTHVFWDAFTHAYGESKLGWSWLSTHVVGEIVVYQVLQYGSSALGLLAVIWWIWGGLSGLPAAAAPTGLLLSRAVRRWVLAASGAGAVSIGVALPISHPLDPVYGTAEVIVLLCAGSVSGSCAVLLVYAMIWQLKQAIGASRQA